MLQLGSTTFEVDDVTVFADHADPNQFYYLASRVELDKRPDGSDAFSLLKWKPAAVQAGVKGGGFLMFQTVVTLPPATRSKILGRIASIAPTGQAKLAAAPIESGTVRCIALNLEGSGGTTATPPPPGAFNAVTTVLGAIKPSLSERENAAFSLVLDQEGATILEKAFESGTTPVGVIYELEYSGLTPDLHVKITADFERIYNHFSASVEAQIYWVKAGIDAGFEKLVQDGAIKIEVIDFEGAADKEAKEKWALDFFKNDLLPKWFEPSLDLGQMKGPAQAEGLDSVLERLKKMQPGAGTTPEKKPETKAETKPDAKPETKAADAKPETKAETKPDAKPAATTPAALAEAKLTPTTPPATPAARTVTLLNPGEASVTLKVGAPTGATLTVGGQLKMLDTNGQASVEVPAGSSFAVAVDWPASAPVAETFPLFFTFDLPKAKNFAAVPTNPVFKGYLQNSPLLPDFRFSGSTEPGKTPPPGGAEALKTWLDNKLVTPKEITVFSHASWEGDSSPPKIDFNQKLSERRLEVAKGIIANRAKITEGRRSASRARRSRGATAIRTIGWPRSPARCRGPIRPARSAARSSGPRRRRRKTLRKIRRRIPRRIPRRILRRISPRIRHRPPLAAAHPRSCRSS